MKVSVYSNFSQIPEDLQSQCSYSNQGNFLSSLDWYRCLFETSMHPDDILRAYFVTDDQGSALVSVFCVHRRGSRALRSLTNFYTTEFEPVSYVDSGSSSEAWATLADHIVTERPAWRSVEFRMLHSSNVANHPLFAGISERGFFTYQYVLYANWFTSINAIAFDEYYQSLTSRLRNTIRRKAKKLDARGTVRMKVFSSKEDDIDAGVRDYVEVYNSSWKNPEPFPDFIPGLAETCADTGTLILGVLYLDDRPIASQFWIVTPAKAVIYKLAYVEDQSDLSPGSILSKGLFEIVIDRFHPKEIDYGVGNEAYKRDWMDQCRSLYALHGYNTHTAGGLALTAWHHIKALLRRVVKNRRADQADT